MSKSTKLHKVNPWPKNPLLKVLGFLSLLLPVGALGLLGALLLKVFGGGADMRWRDGALDVVGTGWFAQWQKARGWAAFSCGGVIFYWTWGAVTNITAAHERWHMWDQMRYWLYFFPSYFYQQWRKGYYLNKWEAVARREARRLTISKQTIN